MINSSNYKIYLIDYSNGLLTQDQVDELLQFINQNAQAKAEFDLIADNLKQPEITVNKNRFANLKKPVYNEVKAHLQNLLINEIEQQNTPEEALELSLSLRNYPQLQTDRQLFKQTILQEDKTIVYPHKAKLKKMATPAKNRSLWVYYATGIAASLLIVGMLFLFEPTTQTPLLANAKKQNTQVQKQPATINAIAPSKTMVEPTADLVAKTTQQKSRVVQQLVQTNKYQAAQIAAKTPQVLPVAASFLKVNKTPVELEMVNNIAMVNNATTAVKPYQTIDEVLLEKIMQRPIVINKDTGVLANISGIAEQLTADNKRFAIKPITDQNGKRTGVQYVTPFFNIERIYATR